MATTSIAGTATCGPATHPRKSAGTPRLTDRIETARTRALFRAIAEIAAIARTLRREVQEGSEDLDALLNGALMRVELLSSSACILSDIDLTPADMQAEEIGNQYQIVFGEELGGDHE